MSDKNDKSEKGSFWTTIPGCLTGIAAIITAIGGLIIGGKDLLRERPSVSPAAAAAAR